jgi:hypothetical protein
MQKRLFRGGIAAAVTAALVAIGAPIVFGGGTPSNAAGLSLGRTYFGIAKPVCAESKSQTTLRCFADERAIVSKGTPGARAFVLGGTATANGTVGPSGGLTPGDLAKVYGLATTGGTGQTVAIVDAFNDPNINSDLQTFDSNYSLAPCSTANACLRIVGQTGSAAALPANDTTGWSAEESLDVETVHALCQACKIILVEANSPTTADMAAAENEAAALHATEISNSFGGPESLAGFTPTQTAAFNHPGIAIVASSGDDGYFDFDRAMVQPPGPNSPQEPAALNTVVSVGGTSLFLNQAGGRQFETVWNNNGTRDVWEETFGAPQGAAGGGCSTVIAARLWQTSERGWASTACGTRRLVADVAAVADPFTGFDVFDSFVCGNCPAAGWHTFGGTSLAAPIVAATFALAGGSHGIQYPALTLYGHPGKLYDVTVGGNGVCGGEGAPQCLGLGQNPKAQAFGTIDCDYPATGTTPSVGASACDAAPGYDGPSGLGTPNGIVAFSRTGPSAAIAAPAVIKHGVGTTFAAASVSDPFPGGKVASYRWNWGDGTVTTSAAASAVHNYAIGGVTRTISLTETDNYGVTNAAAITRVIKVT